MLRWLKRLSTALIIAGLVASNVLSLTSSAFNALLSGAIAGATGIKTLTHIDLDRQRNAVKKMGSRMVARTKRMIARSTVSSTIKWIPILGASVAVGLTIMELSDLCASINDLSLLYQEMDLEQETPLETCQASPE